MKNKLLYLIAILINAWLWLTFLLGAILIIPWLFITMLMFGADYYNVEDVPNIVVLFRRTGCVMLVLAAVYLLVSLINI